METQNSWLAYLSFLNILPAHFAEDVGENSDLSSLKQSCANQITGPFPLFCLALLPVKTMAKGMMRVMELAFLPGYTKKTYETPELFKDS